MRINKVRISVDVERKVYDKHTVSRTELEEALLESTPLFFRAKEQRYLALAKKDRSAYDAYMAVLADVTKYGNLPIPLSIRNPVTKLMKNLGYGAGYEKYPQKSLLPDHLKNKKYYTKII